MLVYKNRNLHPWSLLIVHLQINPWKKIIPMLETIMTPGSIFDFRAVDILKVAPNPF